MGEVSPMHWYLFWVTTVTVLAVWVWFMTFSIHRANTKALEILRIYAERGEEPPPSVAEPLLRRLNAQGERQAGVSKSPREKHWEAFVIFGCTALAWAVVAWWRSKSGFEPQWLFLTAVTLGALSAAFSGSAMLLWLTADRERH